MQKTYLTGVVRTKRVDLADGQTEVVLLDADKATIAVAPGAGGTITVDFTGSAGEHIAAGDALWNAAAGLGAGGVVSASVLDTIPSALTAVRVTAQGATGRVEVTQ
jgi:hypothetical protein